MTPAATQIRWVILKDGPITLAQFMALALTHPDYGYYTTMSPIGSQGDFTTAPEINQTFGEILGLWILDQWIRMGEPPVCALLELGPGRGTLMADILRIARIRPRFLRALSVHLVECSPLLKQHQQSSITGVFPDAGHGSFSAPSPSLFWHRHLTAALGAIGSIPLFFIANEYMDALPIHQYEKTEDGFFERLVTITHPGHGDDFCFIRSDQKADHLHDDGSPVGSIRETCPDAQKTILLLADHLKKHGGAGLVADYGYGGGTLAAGDTFQAVKAHHYHPVFQDVGTADLSAHVNFGVLQTIADHHLKNGTTLWTQGDFLKTHGIMERAEHIMATLNGPERSLFAAGVDRLVQETQMGRLFKVMTLEARKP